MAPNVKQDNSPKAGAKDKVVMKVAPPKVDPPMVNKSERKLRGKKKEQGVLQPSGSFEATYKPKEMCIGKVCECGMVHGTIRQQFSLSFTDTL